MKLPTDDKERGEIPLATFLLEYFPDAIVELAILSKKANNKHNPGEPMHWAREKSNDHANQALRHFFEKGMRDPEDGCRHTAKAAWRMLAMLQLEIEADRREAETVKPHPVDVERSRIQGFPFYHERYNGL